MPNAHELRLSLLDNSHAFLREAVSYAISAQNDARKWQFAVLDLVQSLELSLKSLLFKIHPILIFENIDNCKHTIGPAQAIARLSNKAIGHIVFSETEKNRILKAIDLRNQMTHSEFVLRPAHATAKFFEVFACVVYFQAKHLKTEIEAIIPQNCLADLLAIEEGQKELAEKAQQRIADERIDALFVFVCPNCGNDSFVIKDAVNTCYTCRHTEEIVECRRCKNSFFEWQMEDFSTEFETDYSDGRCITRNNFGYDFHEACFECIGDITNDITDQRRAADEMDTYWYSEMERENWRLRDARPES